MSLTKADIVERIFKEVNIPKKDTIDLVEKVFSIMKKTLAEGEKIKISGFGNFMIRDKRTRTGRNPQTGKSMEIEARRVLTFRPSQVLKDDVTSKYAHRIDERGEENETIPAETGTSRALNSFRENEEES